MAHETSSIDDVLMGQNPANLPRSPESVGDDYVADSPDVVEVESVSRETSASEETQPDEYGASNEAPEQTEVAKEVDEYGNDKPAPKMYTEDEVNERINRTIRERLSRMEKNGQQPTQQQVQQAQQNFNYDADSPESWQQQLEAFVEQTLDKRTQRQTQQAQQMQEQRAMEEFQAKFESGISRFKDFNDVAGKMPITNTMMMATRGLKDPAAFIYAASKRAPQELQRISNIADPYAQIVEIGKLEERMKQTKPTTKAPKPVGRTQEDSPIPHKSDKQPSIEDLIAKDEAKRRAKLNNQRRR
jgi:hypothetical protein